MLARTRFALLLAALAGLALTAPAHADDFAATTTRIVVPFAPGGGTDIISRTLAQEMQKNLGGTVIVENKPGAGGMIGAQAVATAPPDGYTILLGNTTEMVVSPYIVKSATYETQRDFRPVAIAGYLPQLLVADRQPLRVALGHGAAIT